jgi:hypothetical protein
VTHGFDSANNPSGLRNHQRKLSRCRLKNHQPNCFDGWCMDSTAQRALVDSKIINETASTGDAWIRQCKQPMWVTKPSKKTESLPTQKSTRNCFQGWHIDSTAQTTPMDSEIMNETASTADAWIRHRKEPMWAMKSSTKPESLRTQKPSTKLLPRVTHGFDSANNSWGLRNNQ